MLSRFTEQNKGVGDGAAGDAGRGVAGDEYLFAVDQRCAEAGVQQNRLAHSCRLQGAGQVGGGRDIGGRAQGRAAIGQQAEERPAARVFGIMDMKGRSRASSAATP